MREGKTEEFSMVKLVKIKTLVLICSLHYVNYKVNSKRHLEYNCNKSNGN